MNLAQSSDTVTRSMSCLNSHVSGSRTLIEKGEQKKNMCERRQRIRNGKT